MALGQLALGRAALGRDAVRGDMYPVGGTVELEFLVPAQVGGILAPLRFRGSYTPTILKSVSIGQL